MSSTPSTTSSAPPRSSLDRTEPADRADESPPADSRAAFEQALSRLQQARRRGDEEAAPAELAAPASPQQLTPPTTAPLAADMAVPTAGIREAGTSTLGAQEMASLLSSLHVPAAPEGPQQWEFRFGQQGLVVQGLTLTGQPGSTLTMHLHASSQLTPREREISTQRLGELRQRLGERGAPIEGLHWQEGEGQGHHDPEPRR
jgi:hypothetical protein